VFGSPRFEVIATGNELLDASILDRHTHSIGQALRERGWRLQRAQTLPDSFTDLSQAFLEAALRSEVVFVTGGLGPTSDDLSLEVAAKTFDRPMREFKQAKENVLNRMKFLGRKQLNPGHKKQMLAPSGAVILKNTQGTAPGVELSVGACRFYFLPGVPKEFKVVFHQQVLPRIERNFPHRKIVDRLILKVFGWPESEINQLVIKLKFPDFVEFGYRTHFPENHLKLGVPTKLTSEQRSRFQRKYARLLKVLEKDVFSDSWEESFEESFVRRMIHRKKTVSLAESCTGGLVSSMITKVSGSSKVLDRAFVTYSNEAKMDLLGVKAASLKKFGAVSAEVVEQMANGALKNSGASRSVSISGIAGPTGGSRKKPVGTVWFGLADSHFRTKVHQEFFEGLSREEIQIKAAYLALSWILEPKRYA
jgi:nicotinamide-nucleotide amidase